jgi:integrase
MRRAELLTLTPTSFNPNERTLFVKGEAHTKHPEDVVRTVSESTAAKLKEYIVNKMPTVKLFDIQPVKASVTMIREDCKIAGVDVYNAKREKRSFHSLRHCCGSFLAAAGTHPKVVQVIMRHKDINLTMTRYTHTLRGQESKAVNSLPDFTVKRATGTK